MVLSENAADYIDKLDSQHTQHVKQATSNRRYSRRITLPSAPKVTVPKKLKEMKMPSAPKLSVPKVPKKVTKSVSSLKDVKMPSVPKVKVPHVHVPQKLKDTMMKQKLPSTSNNKEAVTSYLAKRKAKKEEKKRVKSLLQLQMEPGQGCSTKQQQHLQEQERLLLKLQQLQQQQQEEHSQSIPRRQLHFPPTIERRQHPEDIFADKRITKTTTMMIAALINKATEEEETKEQQQEHSDDTYQPPSKIVWREESDEEEEESVCEPPEETKDDGDIDDDDDDEVLFEKHIRWQDLEDNPAFMKTAILVQPASIEDVDLQQLPDNDLLERTIPIQVTVETTATTEETPFFKSSSMFDVSQQFQDFDLAKTCESTMVECQPILQNMNDVMAPKQPKKKKKKENKGILRNNNNNKVPDTVIAVQQNAGMVTTTLNTSDAAIVELNDTLNLSALLNSTVSTQDTPEQFLCGIDPDFVEKSMEQDHHHHYEQKQQQPQPPTTPTQLFMDTSTTQKMAVVGTPETVPMEQDDEDDDELEETPRKKNAGRRPRARSSSKTRGPFDSLFGDLSCGMSELYSDFYYGNDHNNNEEDHDREEFVNSRPTNNNNNNNNTSPKKEEEEEEPTEGLNLNHAVRQILWMSA